MIGGMLGMAIVGTLVTHFYVSGVRDSVAKVDASSWLPLLEDPQVLVSASVQDGFLAHLHGLGLDGAPFIEGARVSLVSAVHSGLLAALLIAILALVWVRRVPPIRFSRAAVATPSMHE
jgi:hypothetical protein